MTNLSNVPCGFFLDFLNNFNVLFYIGNQTGTPYSRWGLDNGL